MKKCQQKIGSIIINYRPTEHVVTKQKCKINNNLTYCFADSPTNKI